MMRAWKGQEHVVRKSKFTEDQIAFALKQNELGTSVDEVCRKMGISESLFYIWKKKYRRSASARRSCDDCASSRKRTAS
jgi:putative transposase